MNKSSFCSRIYVYVTYDPTPADSNCMVNIANAQGTSIASGYVDSPAEVADCLSAMGCPPERLPRMSQGEDMVRVLTHIRPRELDAGLALLG